MHRSRACCGLYASRESVSCTTMGNAESPAVAHIGAQQLGTDGSGMTTQVNPKTSVSFTLNGNAVIVENASPYLSLNEKDVR